GEEEQFAFDELKRRFTKSPVLSMYDPDHNTYVEVDALGFTMGAVLSQKGGNGKWHPIAFHSESMNNAEHNYEIYGKEMLTIICALQAWR
ncbi:ribonuclease H family protein, partial [Klebsiella pneumoniae]|uniref:ribonuclease H family protein n=1 Tax=Klebsiella pneumoniae TaxID=573 RepID=UPI001595C431